MKELIFQNIYALVKRILDRAAGIEADSLNVTAIDVLDKTYMDVTETKTYTLVPANSVAAGTRRHIRHPDQYAATTVPIIECSPGDLIYSGGGTQTTISLDQGNSVVLMLVSDGVDAWGL